MINKFWIRRRLQNRLVAVDRPSLVMGAAGESGSLSSFHSNCRGCIQTLIEEDNNTRTLYCGTRASLLLGVSLMLLSPRY